MANSKRNSIEVSSSSGVEVGTSVDGRIAHVNIDDVGAFLVGAATEREIIERNSRNETTLALMGRVTVDLALGEVGTLVGAGIGVYVGSKMFSGNLPVVGMGLAGFTAYEFLRRPLVGIRGIYHSWANPYSPAAQSNERIRQRILDT